MNPVFAVLSGVVALLGLVCLWFWKKLRDEVALIAATPTSRATDVAALAPGTLVEVKGTIRRAADRRILQADLRLQQIRNRAEGNALEGRQE